jgi:hypothetical protein
MGIEGGGLRHLPPSTFSGKFLRKASILEVGVFIDIWSMAVADSGKLWDRCSV